TLPQVLRKFSEDKAEGNAPIISIVVTQSVGHIDVVPKVDHRFATHVGWVLRLWVFFPLPLQSQRRAQAPVRFKVLLDLAINGAQRVLHLFVAELAVGVIDNRNDHWVASFFILFLVLR